MRLTKCNPHGTIVLGAPPREHPEGPPEPSLLFCPGFGTLPFPGHPFIRLPMSEGGGPGPQQSRDAPAWLHCEPGTGRRGSLCYCPHGADGETEIRGRNHRPRSGPELPVPSLHRASLLPAKGCRWECEGQSGGTAPTDQNIRPQEWGARQHGCVFPGSLVLLHVLPSPSRMLGVDHWPADRPRGSIPDPTPAGSAQRWTAAPTSRLQRPPPCLPQAGFLGTLWMGTHDPTPLQAPASSTALGTEQIPFTHSLDLGIPSEPCTSVKWTVV